MLPACTVAVRRPASRPALYICLVSALLAACPGVGGAQPAPETEFWNIAAGDVRVRCRMTIGGSFDAVTSALSGTLRGEPLDPRYTGELRVDLAALDTGIALRNEHLRNSYLELGRGPEFLHAVLSGIVLAATPLAYDRRHKTRFSGTLTLHGVQRVVEGEAELRGRNGRMEVEAAFSLSLDEFDIPPPRYLGIGVRDAIDVTVRFDATRGETPSNDGS
ncbi:MAG: YceI family protein [Acidobacteria bacterium]|nr:YceI family protein [Acidobacteriota bacterium]